MWIVALLLIFILFATSSALTYLSMRSWLYFATHPRPRRGWHETHWVHAARSIGFGCVMMAALFGVINERGVTAHGVDLLSLTRMAGYVLILASTPRRIRRQPILWLSITLLLFREAVLLLYSSGSIASAYSVLILLATAAMDCGMALLWRIFTRTVLRVRLTDKFTLAFSLFSLFMMIVLTFSMFAVINVTLTEELGPDNPTILLVNQNMGRPLVILFVALVAAGAITSFFVARTMIAPVNRMGGALRAIGRGDLDYRLHGIRSRDEMQDLAVELNDMARRLHEADALRAEFVSFASHELRNPLTAVKGFIDTLAMLDTPEADGISQQERIEIYEIVRGECDRLLRMTNELLDNSRVEAGMPVVLNLQQFDVRRRLQKVADVMRQHTSKHDLRVFVPDQSVLIEADPDKLEQILINLLSNAIKYSPQGGPIDVSVEDKDTSVQIDVTDRGIGMTAEQAERVFDKFYRIQDGAGRDAVKSAIGTGIGLYLTRALINAHGGTIRVKSIPAEGSTFTVTLPKKPAPPAPPVEEPQPAEEHAKKKLRRHASDHALADAVRRITPKLDSHASAPDVHEA
jgi:signal transduction histidine kinase